MNSFRWAGGSGGYKNLQMFNFLYIYFSSFLY